MPGQIEDLRLKLTGLEAKMGDPAEAGRIQALSEQYAGVKAEVETAEGEWLRLEMLREELEAGGKAFTPHPRGPCGP